MTGIRKSLLQFVFSGSFMKRWNDKLRPMELIEVDKQAHKMITAWFLYRLNSHHLPEEERLRMGEEIVEGGIFEYLYRLVITDIKPPIFYRIKADPEQYSRLTDWVLEQIKPRVQPLGPEFWERMCARMRKAEPDDTASRILAAAHLFASRWEFHLIKNLNPFDDEIEEIDASFAHGLAEYKDLEGVNDLLRGNVSVLGRFANLCGQLRFQKRWSQTPRIPETSVLGHMYIVACYGYFFSMAVGACRARRLNNFFSGLFHDLPELLTRDIISPVKKSVRRLGDMIKSYEATELRRRVLKPLREGGYSVHAARLEYFLGLETGSEFASAVFVDGKAVKTNFEELQSTYNDDRYDPKDGEMLKICDALAAFIEAYTALRNGINSDQLQQAVLRIRTRYRRVSLGEEVHIGALLADFD